MARATPKMLEVDPETGRIFEESDETPETLQADQDKNFDDIVNEFEAADENVTYRASINRVPDGYKKGGKEEWCFDVDSAEITGVRLKMRDEFGPGIYRVRVFKNKKQVRQFDYYIAKPAITRPVSISPDNAAVQALAEQIRTLNENQSRLMERLLSGPQQNNQTDTLLMMERMSAIFKNMQPPQAQIAQAPPMSIKDAMDLMTKGMEISADLRGSGEESWISVFKELAKGIPVGDIMAKLSEARTNPQQMGQRQIPQQRQLPPHMNNQPPAYAQPPQARPAGPAPESQSATGQQLEQSMRYLIGRAQKNADPGLYAEWLLDNADKELIRQMANDPNVLDQLATIFPILHQPLIRGWFSELVDATKEILAQNQESGDIAAGIDETASSDGSLPHGGSGNASYPGWGSGDQNDPENHAIPGQAGAA